MLSLIEPQNFSTSLALTGLDAYKLNEKQSLVLHERNTSNEILFGGAKGGGKSFLVRYLFSLLCLYCPGILIYLFRRTFADLKQNHMEGPTSFPYMLSKYVNEGKCAIVRSEIRWWNGARIFLNHLQLNKHVLKYQGAEIHVLGFDEWTQFTEYQIRYLYGSVRLGEWGERRVELLARMEADNLSPMIVNLVRRLPLVLGGANPGGESHGFIKKRFIDQGPYVVRTRKEKGEKSFRRQFIPSRAEDNPNLLKNDPDYLDRLESMGDEAMVRAMKEGDWEIVAGSMFGDVFRKRWQGRPWHVRDPFDIPVGWPLWRGMDDGFAAPLACYWNSRNPDTGTRYVIGELYGTKMTAPEVAEMIKERDLLIELVGAHGDWYYNNVFLEGKLDSAAFAETGAAELSRGEQMNRLGCKWTPVEKWPGSRVARVQNLHRLLKPNVNERMPCPGIVFFSTCVNAIETIPAILRDEKNPEDVSDKSILHAFDGVTYSDDYVKPAGGRKRVG